MEYRNFGTSGVKISSICLGAVFRVASDDDVWELDEEEIEEIEEIDDASAWAIGATQIV